MKTKFFIFAVFATFFANGIFAQDKTTVTATSTDISDNLDLKAVASIFGDSANLDEFEKKLNDPKMQISNLDLNSDNQVDYLRVVESVEGNTHVIIIQAVLDKDVYQDIATVEVEKDSNNQVQVQVVGDTYMYGDNYIYEPVYVHRPLIYDYFWVGDYHPYISSWYWGYYPSYYTFWAPYPIYRYRHHVHSYINVSNHYNYVNVRRNPRAAALANHYRGNGYELRNPNHSFHQRNATVNNRRELDQVRHAQTRNTPRPVTNPRTGGTRAQTGVRTQTSNTRSHTATRSQTTANPNVRSSTSTTVQNPRTRTQSVNVRTEAPRANPNVRTQTATPRAASPRVETPRANTRVQSPRISAPQQAPRVSAPAGGNEQRGGGRR